MNTANSCCNSFAGYEYFGVQFTSESVCARVCVSNAVSVFLTGDFCNWQQGVPMSLVKDGIWECEIARDVLFEGCKYKYRVLMHDGAELFVADPYEACSEGRGGFASVVCDLNTYEWHDTTWLEYSKEYKRELYKKPLSIYKLSADLWRVGAGGDPLDYVHLATELSSYVKQLGCTHVELDPLSLRGDDAYVSYFAPRTAQGTPHELMKFVDTMHEAGVGVIFDLPISDGQALPASDVCAFWLDKYHADGLCVGAIGIKLAEGLREKFPHAILIGSDSDNADAFDLFCDTDPDSRSCTGRVLSLCSYEAFVQSSSEDRVEQLENMRAAFEELMVFPCKKLIIMGSEIGDACASLDGGVDWSLLGDREHAEFQKYVAELGQKYLCTPQP